MNEPHARDPREDDIAGEFAEAWITDEGFPKRQRRRGALKMPDGSAVFHWRTTADWVRSAIASAVTISSHLDQMTIDGRVCGTAPSVHLLYGSITYSLAGFCLPEMDQASAYGQLVLTEDGEVSFVFKLRRSRCPPYP